MSSEMAGMAALGGMVARMRESQAWTEANPALARDWDDAREEDDERERRGRAAAAVPAWLGRLGVPDTAIEALARRKPTQALEEVEGFLANAESRFLLLLGGVGAGKTVAAARALAWWRERPGWGQGTSGAAVRDAMFVRATTFGRLSGYQLQDRAWFEDLCRAPVVVLDDLGTEHLNDFGRALFEEWFDFRAGRPGRTVMTTNLDKQAFVRRYGMRAADRVGQLGRAVELQGRSLRRES